MSVPGPARDHARYLRARRQRRSAGASGNLRPCQFTPAWFRTKLVHTDRRCWPRPTAAQSDRRVSIVTIKAVVFDAYGTLYDIQSVAAVTEEAFPGYGDIITQIWRIKQLEYTWLRSLMRRYEDFSVVTRESLAYTLRCLGLKYDEQAFARHHGQVPASRSLSGCAGVAGRDEGQEARDPLQRQPRHAERAGEELAASTACSTPPSASTPTRSSSRARMPTP